MERDKELYTRGLSLSEDRDVFLTIFKSNGGKLEFSLYLDELPTTMQLRALPPLIYKRKLEGKWKHWSLNDLVKEVERRYAAGIPLPPDNTIPPPLEKKTVAQQNAEIVNASIPLSSSS